MTTCPKCGYVRQPTDLAPDYECPKCRVCYSKFELQKQKEAEAQRLTIERLKAAAVEAQRLEAEQQKAAEAEARKLAEEQQAVKEAETQRIKAERQKAAAAESKIPETESAETVKLADILDAVNEVSQNQALLAALKTNKVVMFDLDMPFDLILRITIKWALASIPAFLMLAGIGVLVWAFFGALLKK